MARIRTIKPEFWKSEAIVRLPIRTRLTFIGLWTYVDDNGVGIDNEKLIVAELFPLEDDPRDTLANVSRDIQILAEESRIIRYTVGGKRFLAISNWSEHQKIDKPGKARYPGPEAKDADTKPADADQNAASNDDSRNPRDTLAKPSRLEQGTGNREQGSREEGTGEQGTDMPDAAASSPAAPAEPCTATVVFDHWRVVMAHPNAKLDDKRKKAIKAALKLGYGAHDLAKAIDGCKKSKWHMGANDRSTVFDGLDLILRDAAHIDKFIALERAQSAPDMTAAGIQTMQAGQRWLANQSAIEAKENEDAVH